MSELKELLNDAFITANSTPSGEYSVNIKVRTLKECHLVHREIINIRQGKVKLEKG
jgi:hypothetical protein